MLEQLAAIEKQGLAEIKQAADPAAAQDLHQRYLGKKGELAQLLRGLGALAADERPLAGKRANEVKQAFAQALSERRKTLAKAEPEQDLVGESVDITLPGARPACGSIHPLTRIFREIRELFVSMGFSVAHGPDIETEFNNFGALNFPLNHPARDIQDTFYLPGELLLRTHTSPVQIRTMLAQQPPLAIIAPGACYRSDDIDASHSPMFHQVEGLLIDEGISFGDLKGVLETFIRGLFGPETPLRLRPHFFPFTEPSAEGDMGCVICHGSGCRLCSHTGWLEILGAGMVHPNVLSNVGYDPEKYQGFAFGVGVDRLAMLKYRIGDMRLLFENDVRFLKQF